MGVRARCKEYWKQLGRSQTTTAPLWGVVLVVSVEDHPTLGHAEYAVQIGHPHGLSEQGADTLLNSLRRTITPTDGQWKRSFDLKFDLSKYEMMDEYDVVVRWNPPKPALPVRDSRGFVTLRNTKTQ